jgi:phosphoribosyl-ATP pyrophosphohydrolase
MGDSITRLYRTAKACRHDDPSTSRTARLLRSGRGKIAKKFAEEAIEVVIDTVQGGRDAIVKKSADLIYNLVVLWISADIHPDVVWKELERQPQLGFARNQPKKLVRVGRKNASRRARAAPGSVRSPQSRPRGSRWN